MLSLLLAAFGCRKVDSSATAPSRGEEKREVMIPRWGTAKNIRPDLRVGSTDYELYWDQFTFTEDFRTMVEGHLSMELVSESVHLPHTLTFPQVITLDTLPPSDVQFTRIVSSPGSSVLRDYHLGIPDRLVPLRSYRAPIFEAITKAPPLTGAVSERSNLEASAAALVESQLGRQGLMATLLDVMHLLGPERFLQDPELALREVRNLGIPVDWLMFFASHWQDAEFPRRAMVKHFAQQLSSGQSLEDVKKLAATTSFVFTPSFPDYQVAMESGREKIGMIRMQMGGGYHDGIVPGGSIDLISQMVSAFPESDFMVHVPENILENVKWMARRQWPLHRTNQVTFLAEYLKLAPWAQDNGKAGLAVFGSPSFSFQSMTLIPRYASQEEAPSRFMPSESFLMATLKESGHFTVQSPLLFQGGNLLAVYDPSIKKRVLLVGDAEVQRNQALGLTSEQVMQAFRVEFGVDECVRLPAASFHIDYDMTIREHEGRLLVFVNDTESALGLILQKGIEAMLETGMLTAAQAVECSAQWQDGRHRELLATLGAQVYPRANAAGVYSLEFQNLFAAHPVDSSSQNMRVFLVALDLLASRVLTEKDRATLPKFYREYLASLRFLETQARKQQQILQERGWEIVSVPSLPDVPVGLNYLNGLHDRDQFLMPAQGGFYQALDAAAAKAFTEALGPGVKIVPILTGECQRSHGAIHCAAAAYPKSEPSRDDS